MSENMPNMPGGAMPPKPAEASKVQPKKETVRINLPPKPTSAPTIKLPSLAPGAPPPSAMSAAAPVAAPAPAPPAAAPAGPRMPAPPAPPPASGAPRATASAVQKAATATTQAAAQRPAYTPPSQTVSGLDKGLAIAALVIGLAAVGSAVYLWKFIPGVTGN